MGIVSSDGTGAHELLRDGVGRQGILAWSPDGTHLLYTDESRVFVTDLTGGQPQVVDTGCAATQDFRPNTCHSDSDVTFSQDGRKVVFLRFLTDDAGLDASAIVTMDLLTGRIAVLNATSPDGGANPAWAPDGRRIVFGRYGEKDSGGPVPPTNDALFVIDVDGGNLHQLTPATLAALSPEWSPDGDRIVFVSEDNQREHQDVYTVRPDGSDVRRLTDDGGSRSPSWTADGRILFTRSGKWAGFWMMDADGANAAMVMSAAAIGVAPESAGFSTPAWQPLGGAAIVPLPWTPESQVAVVGPPAPTPSPTPIPALAPGFTWTGAPAVAKDGSIGETATRLADGRVLLAGGCGTAAQVYDPKTGTFSPTGSLAQSRGGTTATLLRDGHVLFTGGGNCGPGQDGIWASAELYDPTTGTFSPTGSMAAPREQHTATLLADGRVLIAGGLSGSSPASAGGITLAAFRTADVDRFLTSAELYDPSTGRFSKTGSMTSPHRGHTATLLLDGGVLVVGNGGESSPSGKIADLYDPTTGRWTRTGSMKAGRWLQTATLLPDGRVLILGGRSPRDSVYAGAELYDPRAGTFGAAGQMREGRQQFTATLLPDGRVFIAGGYWSDGQKWRVLASTEMYDPSTGNFSPVGSMGASRDGHHAILLDDGRILILGGEDIGSRGGVGVASAVLYQP